MLVVIDRWHWPLTHINWWKRWLSPPPPQVSPIFPIILCIYTCVLCLSVASSFCFVKPAIGFPSVPVSRLFLVSQFWPFPPALSLPAVLYLCPTYLDYWPLPALDLSFPCPCWINKLLLVWHCLHLVLTLKHKSNGYCLFFLHKKNLWHYVERRPTD